jgi:hypothetical protein
MFHYFSEMLQHFFVNNLHYFFVNILQKCCNIVWTNIFLAFSSPAQATAPASRGAVRGRPRWAAEEAQASRSGARWPAMAGRRHDAGGGGRPWRVAAADSWRKTGGGA